MLSTMQIIVVLSGVITGAIAQVLLKKGALNLPVLNFDTLIRSPYFITAILIQISSAVLWLFALKNMDLSKAYPLTALAFIIVPILSYYMFGETVNLKYCMGIVLIIIGIIIAIQSK